MQNDPNLGVKVFFSSFSKWLGESLEITLKYETADTFVNSGKLTLLNISTLDRTEIILNVEVKDERIELLINYQYFFENFLRLFKDKTKEQRSKIKENNISNHSMDDPFDDTYGSNIDEFNEMIDKGIDYFNGSETMFEYKMKSNQYYNEKTDDIIVEGEKEDFQKELMNYKQKYKHEIQKHKSLKHFLSYYEKIYLKNFKANLTSTEINYK